jgi:thiol-disulfide isomerase/thioredoxin
VKNIKLRVVFLIAIVLILLSVGCEPYAPTEGALVGRAAPQFTLKDLDGRDVSLQQYRGKIVMLDFWATWCGPCRVSMPILEKIRDQYAGKLVLLAVNLQESKDVVKEYVLSQNLGSKVLLDRDASVGGLYGVIGIPTQVLIDQEGTVKFMESGVGPGMDSKIRAEINKLL